jgi:membrane-associated protein
MRRLTAARKVCAVEEAILEYMHPLMTSPWIFVIIFGISFLDGFFPVVPGETSVIIAGASAASLGSPHIGLVIVAAAAGAFLGDHVSYAIGRFGFGRISRNLKDGTKKKKAFDWAHDSLLQRGGIVLVVARYIPGGRTAITITCGAVRYPLRKFVFFEFIAALSWAVYSGVIGFVAGSYFKDRPLMALALGFAIAMTCAGFIEGTRHLLSKRAAAREVLHAAEAAVETAVAAPAPRTANENAVV